MDNSNFLKDVLRGLTSSPKYLQSKYFYNKKGDELFQKIMNCEDYYLTRCEMEIFQTQSSQLAELLFNKHTAFDVVELGAGDATKSLYLLKNLTDKNINFTYFPVDISKNIIDSLHKELPKKLPELKVQGLHGEYFDMLAAAKKNSSKIKLVLFLGSNIGNIKLEDTISFFNSLRNNLSKGDLLLTGFDLKKNPYTILKAYNDGEGFTEAFNLNLLERINEELGADFNLNNFQHYPYYNPLTGSARSFLVSLKNQTVKIKNQSIHFIENELIDMEISQKYSPEEIYEFAQKSNFKPLHQFFDSKKWFVDTLWEAI